MFERSKGRPATAADAKDSVGRLATTAVKGGWFKAGDRNDFLMEVADISSTDDASNKDSVPKADAEVPAPAGQDRIMVIDVPTDVESYERFLEEYRQRKAAEQAAAGTGGANGAHATEPHPGSPEYRAADAQARTVVAEQGGNPSEVQRAETSPPAKPRGASMAVPMPPEMLPGSAVLEKLVDAVSQAARRSGPLLARAAPAAAGAALSALSVLVIPTNSQEELHPIGEKLRVRTAPGQRSATVQLRVDDGLFATGIAAKWIDLPVGAAWANDDLTRRRYIAIDRHGLEQAIGRDAADAALGGNGIAEARRPSKDGGANESDYESRGKKDRSRDRRQERPPQAEDLEQRPDRPPTKPPHELSDAEIADIAHKIASGHAKAKHQKEFPELGSDVEFELHIADVIKNNTENKTTPDDHTAYWHKDSRTTVVFDPLAPDNGTVVRSEHGRRFFDNIPTKY
ncbi:hypothetical protein BH10PSE6_BH10PSE6_42130 [soil metagenome]